MIRYYHCMNEKPMGRSEIFFPLKTAHQLNVNHCIFLDEVMVSKFADDRETH